jgi:Protein of unknown function (DUF3102)
MICPHCKKDTKIVKRVYGGGRPDDWMCHACGTAVEDYQPEFFTSEASEIGRLYRQAKSSFVNSVKALIECGERLKAQKDKLSHGEWLPWLQANESELGFTDRTARMLMDAASRPFSTKRKLASDLTEVEALDISRQIWGHREPEPNTSLTTLLTEAPNTKPASHLTEAQVKPPSFPKPVIGIAPPPRLDNNPRQCRASCCPDGSDTSGPWNVHDAQAMLDQKGFRYGHFGKDHMAVLDFGVECEQLHLLAQLHGLQRSGMIPERNTRFKGIGQGRN